MTQQAVSYDDEVIAYQLHGNCYLNITWQCTLRCAFCPKFNGDWEVQGYHLRLRKEPSFDEIIAAVGDPSPFQEIVFCGLGEPTERLDTLLEVAKTLRDNGARIRVNTDGLANLRCGEDVTPRLAGVVDALSISLNAQDELTYNRHCRPKLAGAYAVVLEFARLARVYVPDVVVSAIEGLPGVDIAACQTIASQLGVGFKRRALDAVG